MRVDDSGYVIEPSVFGVRELTDASEALASAQLQRTKAGARHVLGLPAVRALANDLRMLRIAERFIGKGGFPFRATFFDKSASANWLVTWHQDTALPLRVRVDNPDWGPWSTKGGVLYAHAPAAALETVVAVRVSLDDSASSNGPLRVLPGTHDRGVLNDREIAALASTIPAVECTTPAGGLVIMRPLTVHASSKSTDNRPRRVLHIEYASVVQMPGGAELLV